MINKNYIFLIFSILLGLIISFFYDKNLIVFLSSSIILMVLFYFLGSSKENFDNYYSNNFYDNKFFDNEFGYAHGLGNENNEEEFLGGQNSGHEHRQNSGHEHRQNSGHEYLQEEQDEDSKYDYQDLPEHDFNIHKEPRFEEDKDKNQDNNKIIEEESHPIKPNENGNLNLSNIPIGTAPLNINISYNSQNSTNNLDNNKMVIGQGGGQGSGQGSGQGGDQNNKHKKKCNKNLGSYNYSESNDYSRVYNNSDWIYGDYAWTNDPDYYIPEDDCKQESINSCPAVQVSQKLNEIAASRNRGKQPNNVCPLMINTPWSEYKSGDSEPEPYNL